MSRHRDVRCMNYSDEYEGYDDIYGHSIEDDYCVSPSAEQFMFDRNKQQNISSYFTGEDIVEGDEDLEDITVPSNCRKSELTDLEAAKLASCIEIIRNVIGDSIPESSLTEKIIKFDFNSEAVLDAILKDTTSKSTNEQCLGDKDCSDSHSGSSLEKVNILKESLAPQTVSTFAIPKLSFQKRHVLKKESNKSFASPSVGLENLTNNESSIYSRPLLPQMTASCTVSPSESRMTVQSFSSLADLTAHHLQKSGSLNDIKPCQTTPVKSGFVIPKLQKQNDKDGIASNTLASEVQQNVKHDDTINLLQNSLSDMCIALQANKNETCDPQITSADVSKSVRTPSPDDWMIDLSTALREAKSTVTKCTDQADSKLLTNFYHDISPLDLYSNTVEPVPSETMIADVHHDCNLDLSSLQHIKLPYSNKTASLFGKILCKKWKQKKPYVKHQEELINSVKHFDFSTPSPDCVILANLRKV